MFDRHARARVLRLARGFPVVVLTGPRQSGKTTLARAAFPGHAYPVFLNWRPTPPPSR